MSQSQVNRLRVLLSVFVARMNDESLGKWKRLHAETFACRAQFLLYKITGELVELA